MRTIKTDEIIHTIKEMCIEANHYLTEDMEQALNHATETEKAPLGKQILCQLRDNLRIASEDMIPICQDTGMACVFMEIGQEVHFTGGDLTDAVNEGVRRGCLEGFLRQTIVRDPFDRVNTGDSTPADINMTVVPGDRVKITVAPKGFGSENMSRIKMLPPAAGVKGAEDFIVETCSLAGGNPCPPIIVGVGIGGSFTSAPLMARKALLRPVGSRNASEFYREMEIRLLERINGLGIGPQGFGGETTALAVNVIAAPTHIAGMPVAVNINCHVSRHKEVIL